MKLRNGSGVGRSTHTLVLPDQLKHRDRHGFTLFSLTRRSPWSGVGCGAMQMGKAKILSLIIDRREVGEVGAFDGLPDEQLVEEAAKRARALGITGPRLVEHDNKKPR